MNPLELLVTIGYGALVWFVLTWTLTLAMTGILVIQ